MVSNVCAVADMGGEFDVFVLDLDGVKAGSDSCDRAEDGFVKKDPNVIIRDAQCSCFCGVNGNLFMIEGVVKRDWVTGFRRLELPRRELPAMIREAASERVKIYNCGPLREFLHCSNLVVSKSIFPVVSVMDIPKVIPAAVRCEDGILIFSTEIAYASSSDSRTDNVHGDFSLFEVDTLKTYPLPQLSIYRSQTGKGACKFWLVNPDSEPQPVMPKYPSSLSLDRDSSFYIVAFAMTDQATLVVRTNFGCMFYLGLHPPTWHVFEGTALSGLHENMVTKDYRIALSPFGASRFSTADGGGGGRIIGFPLSTRVPSVYSWRNSCIGLPEKTEHPYYVPFILRVGFDLYESAYWTLDAVELDAWEFDEELPKFGRRTKSFKFTSDICGLPFVPVCVYPF